MKHRRCDEIVYPSCSSQSTDVEYLAMTLYVAEGTAETLLLAELLLATGQSCINALVQVVRVIRTVL